MSKYSLRLPRLFGFNASFYRHIEETPKQNPPTGWGKRRKPFLFSLRSNSTPHED